MAKRREEQSVSRTYFENMAKLIGNQRDFIKDINQDIYGIEDHRIDMSETNEKISLLVNNMKHNMGGDLLTCLDTLKKEFNADEKNALENFRKKLEKSENVSMFQSFLRVNDSKVNKYEDLKLITSIMPQLRQAKTAIVNSIMSPDDFTKQISLNMDMNGKSLADTDKIKYNSINKVLKKHKFTKLMKRVIDNTVTLGEYYVVVLPYKKLFNDLLKTKFDYTSDYVKNKTEKFKYDDNQTKMLKESVTDVNSLCEMINNIYERADVHNDSSNLLSEAVILSELKKASVNKEDKKEFDDIINSLENDNDSKLKRKKNSEISDGFLEDNKEDIKISGCKIKKLDPRRLLELSIDEDNCMGYLYIETQDSARAIRDFKKFNFRNDINNIERENVIDDIYKNIGDMLWKKLDKKFIENHTEIKERLYDILKFSDVNKDSRIKVSYLTTDEVVKFEINDGESVFEPSLFFSRLYMMVLLSTITARVIRGNDIRAYYVDVDADGGMNNMIYNAIDTLQATNHSILGANHISKLISTFTVFDDLIIPRANGENQINFDIISGQSVDIPTDLLELLEKICVDSTGTPLQLIQSSTEADFARTYTMLNISFMKSILDLQTDINPSITELVLKIIKCELGDDDEIMNIIDNLECYLQSPMNLLLTNLLEQINNAKDAAQGIMEVICGTNADTTDLGEAMDKLMLSLCKKYAPNIPWSEFEELFSEIKLKLTPEKMEQDQDENI